MIAPSAPRARIQPIDRRGLIQMVATETITPGTITPGNQLPAQLVRLVPVLLIAHFIVWTLLPYFLHPNLQRDQIEGFAWGFEWQWGYAKHPPLWAWMLEATTFLTGTPQALSAYALGSASGVGALYCIWRLGQRLASPVGAAIAVLSLEGVLYLNFRTVDFNANVVLLPAWAAAGLFLHRALIDDRWRDWIGLGLILALGLYGKYATGVLILAIAGFIFMDPQARRYLTQPKLWAGVVTGLCVLAPHLFWLTQHGLQPVDYAMARTGQTASLISHITQPVIFLFKQVPEILGLLILAALLRGRDNTGLRYVLWQPGLAPSTALMERRMILMLALGPLAITSLICGVLGRPFVAAWGLPMFCYSGLLLVMLLAQVRLPALVRFARGLTVVIAVIIASFSFYYGLLPDLRHRPSKTQFPGSALAQMVVADWQALAGNAPLSIVAGPIYVAGNAAFHLSQMGLIRPHVLIDGDRAQSPWIRVDMIQSQGLVFVWLDEGQGPPAGLAQYPQARIMPSRPLAFAGSPSLAPLMIGMAIVPPVSDPSAFEK